MQCTFVYNPDGSHDPRRRLSWIGTSLQDVRRLPAVVRRAIGFELDAVQRGMDPADWKPMPAVGLGVREVRIHVAGEHRVLYLARLRDAVHVLHVFEKKSRRTSGKDLALGRVRYRQVLQRHLDSKDQA